MRHVRDYADVPDATEEHPKPTNIGFLGAPYPFSLSPGNLFDITAILVAALAIYNWMS